MDRDDVRRGLLDVMDSVKAMSAHEHHRPQEEFEGFDLDRLIAMSYPGWCGIKPEGDPVLRKRFLEEVRFNSYFRWLWEGVRRVHGIEGELTLERWEEVSETIAARHRSDPLFHVRMLSATGYERLIQDSYWDPGSDVGHPEVFSVAFRIDPFLYGYHEEGESPDGVRTWGHFGIRPSSFDDYIEWVQDEIRRRRTAGTVALKSAEAYARPLDYGCDDEDAARKAWGTPPSEIDRDAHLAFGRFIFNRCCEVASELDIPFQVHTGLGQLYGTSPMTFLPLVERYPGVRFVFFHYGYPWCDDLHGIIHNHRNAFPDFTWLPLISTSAAERVLEECVEVVQNARSIGWGSDCWTGEESAGALAAWKSVVSNVLSGKVSEGGMALSDAERLALMLVRENWLYIYS